MPSDLVSAARTHMRPRRSTGMIGFVIVALFCWALWSDFSRHESDGPPWQSYAGLGLAILLALMFGVWLPYKIRRTFSQRKDLHRECRFVATPEGLQFASDGVDGIKPWDDYLKWREGRAVLLLYVSDDHYQMIPKRFFEAVESLSVFRTVLQDKIGKPI